MSAAPLDAAVVLCGGRSRRMGRDKAALIVGGATLLARAVRAAGEAAPRVLLACGPEPRYADLGLELVLDRDSDGGPLAGLEAALARLGADGGGWLGVVACDMPRAAGDILRLCAERGRERDLDAVHLARAEGGLEPLFGAVHTRALPAVRAALERGERRAIAFHGDVRVGTLAPSDLSPELRALDPARNLNTPWDLEREREEGS